MGLLILLLYLWWLARKRPYARVITYRFVKSGFQVRLNRWRNKVIGLDRAD